MVGFAVMPKGDDHFGGDETSHCPLIVLLELFSVENIFITTSSCQTVLAVEFLCN